MNTLTTEMDKELKNQKMVNQLSTITKTIQYFTQLGKADTLTELEEPENVEKLN